MSTSAEQISALIAAATDLKSYFEGVRDAIDGKVDDVLLDMSSFIAEQFQFQATWDPTEANPTNERDGVYSSLATLMSDAPRGSTVFVTLPAGQVCSLTDERVFLHHKYVIFQSDAANRATLHFPTFIKSNGNAARNRLFALYDAEVQIRDVDLMLDGLPPTATNWQTSEKSAFCCGYGHKLKARLDDCMVTGLDGACVATCANGVQVQMLVSDTAVDGNMTMIADATSGVAIVSRTNMTFANGATLNDTGTIVSGTVLAN
ncbi:hypothetical protein MHM88_05730 [Epibacterium sp. MM17-32]|uniref:hypothetical protein n=1 Tax=Epibacterium sp. MM17-32 TaxID=2917734 RepID=UPI001EF51557|nr:hypothetical protein [Epibacterium sp. MM17-32]MCG7627298.1 hypothetical protein [Epibacterium sp. MM17-32]